MKSPSVKPFRKLPIRIAAATTAVDRAYVAAYRNTNAGIDDNTCRCFGADWKEVWSRKVELDPAGICHHPSGVIAVTRNFRTSAGYLYCLDAASGEVGWRRKLRSPDSLMPVVIDEDVLIVADGKLNSFRVSSGKPMWAYTVTQMIYPALAWPEASAVIVGHFDGMITRVDSRDGAVVWSRKLPGESGGIVCRCRDRLFAAGWSGPLHQLDPSNGRVLAKSKAKVWSNVVAHGNQLLFQTKHDNDSGYRMGSVNQDDLRTLWELDVPFSAGDATFSPEPLQVVSGELLVKTHCGPLYAIDIERGRISWEISTAALERLDPSATVLGVTVIILGQDLWMQAGERLYKIRGR